MPATGNLSSFRVLTTCICVVALTACGGGGDDGKNATPGTPPVAPVSTFVVLGENGIPVARALTEASVCPSIELDGRSFSMEMRAQAGTMPARPTRPEPTNPNPAAFPISTCEKILPSGTRSASINGQSLPLPAASPKRIVVIGDTGCRQNSQKCDPVEFPFAQIAERAALWKPDLVVHVGDYHYRGWPCQDGRKDCPVGFGYDTWRADFFDPADKLLRAAPWVITRGNHESCNLAGQGYWRFLDPRPLLSERDCNDPANDKTGDYGSLYTVPLSEDTRLIVADSSNAPERKLDPNKNNDKVHFEQYQNLYKELASVTHQAQYNVALFHQPLFGLRYDRKRKVFLGVQPALHSAFKPLNPQLLPDNVQVVLSGHVHTWAQLNFSSGHPTQFIAGFSGAKLDEPVSGGTPGKTFAGVVLSNSSGLPKKQFGYMTMERGNPGQWDVKVWDQTGAQIKSCQITGKQSSCSN